MIVFQAMGAGFGLSISLFAFLGKNTFTRGSARLQKGNVFPAETSEKVSVPLVISVIILH